MAGKYFKIIEIPKFYTEDIFKKIKKTSKFDIPYFVTNNRKINNFYNWIPLKNIDNILKDIHEWLINNKKIKEYFR